MNRKRIFSIVILSFLILLSCSDESGINNTENNEFTCEKPTDFELLEYSLLSKVELGWVKGDNETAWQIEYGHTGFTLGSGSFVESTTEIITISSLDFNVAYDFYIRSFCGTNNYSDWVGPVKNIPDTTTISHALMTANINGSQYNNLVPNGWNFFNTAINVLTFTTNNEKYIHIQGNSHPGITLEPDSKEINLYIPESLWAVGTYTLGNNSVDNNQVPIPHVNIIYNDSSTPSSQAFELENGTISITEIDLVNRVIKGTFEFQFEVHYVGTNDILGPLDCLSGTFDYSLDDEYFD
jgi:hypothetical protein